MNAISEVDERTLREVYFVPFEAAVRLEGHRAHQGLEKVGEDLDPRLPLGV